jgi:flagellar L-ring protein precursor FlgH
MRHPFVPLLLIAVTLAGCSVAGELANVGRTPRFSKAEAVPAPTVERSLASSGMRDDIAVPSASSTAPASLASSSASLFRAGAAGLFQDQRAHQRGDILTVRINVADKAAFDNASDRSRTGSESASIASLLGIDKLIDKILPGKQTASPGADSTSKSSGQGSTHRSETINLTLSAIVIDVLPNGNMMIRGRQEMRVNYELRELTITGLIRPQDIARDNSIRHTQIAEARVAYGGHGQLTQAQQARYGQQIFNMLFPF